MAVAIVAAGALVALPGNGGAAGAKPTEATAGGPSFFDSHEARDKDNRPGMAAPSARQMSIASRLGGVEWNALGTPHALTAAKGPLATGLSTDAETAARQYLVANRDLFGLDEAAVAAMDRLLVSPIGPGAVVTLQQRFGNLPA